MPSLNSSESGLDATLEQFLNPSLVAASSERAGELLLLITVASTSWPTAHGGRRVGCKWAEGWRLKNPELSLTFLSFLFCFFRSGPFHNSQEIPSQREEAKETVCCSGLASLW